MDIRKSKYTGYLWYSNSHEPEVLVEKDFELHIADDANPFVVEAMLCDGERSLTVQFVDGEYIVSETLLNDIELVLATDVYYKAKKMGNSYLHFKRVWSAEADDACCGMDVLTPSKLVFVGFLSNEEE